MRIPARLIFSDSTYETILDAKPNPGDVIDVLTNQGKLRLQVKQVTWLNRPEGLIVELRFFDPPKITFRQLSVPIDLFAAYPEIHKLGRAHIQCLCDEWVKTPVARETGVSEIKIDEKLVLSFIAEIGSSPKEDEVYHFPADDLLRFIVENGFESREKDALLAKIASNRRRVGPEVYQRFLVSLPGAAH